ncbi:MAG TPA: hypothetical protein VIL01_12215 [Thermomicrobiales bacterium]
MRSRRGWTLLAAAEPVDPSGRAERVAAGALAAFRHGFTTSDRRELSAAMMEAYAAADHYVREANHWRERGDRRPVRIGIASVVVAGDDLLVALAPPGQILIAQERRLCAYPSLRTWDPRYDLDDAALPGEPLGGPVPVKPFLATGEAARDDVIVVGPSPLGRALAAPVAVQMKEARAATLAERIQLLLAASGYEGVEVLTHTIEPVVPEAAVAEREVAPVGPVARPVPVEEPRPSLVDRLYGGLADAVAAFTAPPLRPAMPGGSAPYRGGGRSAPRSGLVLRPARI